MVERGQEMDGLVVLAVGVGPMRLAGLVRLTLCVYRKDRSGGGSRWGGSGWNGVGSVRVLRVVFGSVRVEYR